MKQHRNGFFKDGAEPPDGYWIWAEIRQRCHNMQSWAWKWYGGRGIKVCERWDDPAVFLADMGPRPTQEHTIDRIDCDGDYEPGNCRWATMLEQCRNKRGTRRIDGMTIGEIADALGMSYYGVYYRIVRGWSPEEICKRPKITDGTRKTNRMITANGKTQSLTEWAKEAGVSVSTIDSRIKNGWSAEEAVRPGLHKAKGDRCPHSKLTAEIVREIRSSKEKGTDLARKYGVSSTLIYSVRKRRIWEHVNP